MYWGGAFNLLNLCVLCDIDKLSKGIKENNDDN